MYFTVVLSTDATYRDEFAEDVAPELRQALAVRASTGTARRGGGADAAARGDERMPRPALDDLHRIATVFDQVWGRRPR